MTTRELVNPEIVWLMHLHDRMELDNPRRKEIERRILFLMDAVKCAEFEAQS